MKYDLIITLMNKKNDPIKFCSLTYEKCLEVMNVFVENYDYNCEFKLEIV